MAKRRSSAAMQVYRAPAFAPRSPAPIIRIATPRAITAPKKRHTRRRSAVSGGGSTKDVMMKLALGAGALGLIEKHFTSLPTIPVLGRKGTIALGAYMLGGKKPGLIRDIAISAAVLAAYELAKDGKVSGDDD